MKLLALCLATVVKLSQSGRGNSSPVEPPPGSPMTKALYDRIERLCQVTVGEKSSFVDGRQVRAEELRDMVVKKLLAEDCRRLKQFEGEPPPKSWLCAIIRNASIDLYRMEHGRIDKSRMSETEEMIYRLAIQFEYPSEEIRDLLKKLPESLDISLEEIERMIEKVRPKPRRQSDPNSSIEVIKMYDSEEDMENIYTDRNDPEKLLMKGREIRNEQLKTELFLDRLEPYMRLVISMFFGIGGDKYTLKEIADVLYCLGIETTETALQKQKNRTIEEFRAWLAKQKLSLDELIVKQTARSAS
jgi:DNA-directed RNA polymerase specialized sigma24 family protein